MINFIQQEFEKIFYGGEQNIPRPLVGDHTDGGPNDLYITEDEKRIDCGLKSVDSDQYRRDYVVQRTESKQLKGVHKQPKGQVCHAAIPA